MEVEGSILVADISAFNFFNVIEVFDRRKMSFSFEKNWGERNSDKMVLNIIIVED